MIKIGKTSSNISVYTCQPKTKEELIKIIKKRIRQDGIECDLNDIDTSKITNMSFLFNKTEFNGDISKWDVNNVKTMQGMFYKSDFNGDISSWDVSNVKNMSFMFCDSKFNKDISKWNVNKKSNTRSIFSYSCIREEHKPKSLQQL